MLRKLWKWLAAGLSVVVILLGLAVGLFRLLLPLIPHYHERIEAFASEAAGTAVEIESVTARWSFSGPELRFNNARLLTADGAETLLGAAEGSVVLDLGALLRQREFRAGQILLEGLSLDLRRDSHGRWHIGGRELASTGDALPKRLSLGLRNSKIEFRDEISGAGPWIFDDVELNVQLQNTHLSIDSAMRLPPGLGRSAEMSIEAQGDLAQFDTLRWQTYLRGDDIDLFGWSALMPADRVAPGSGRGDLVFWFASVGKSVQQASLVSDLRDVSLSQAGLTVRELDQVVGRFEYDRVDSGWQANGRDIVIASAGESWPVSGFTVEQVGDTPEYNLIYADFDYLRLDDLAPFADWIPQLQWREMISELSPRGVIEQVSLRMTRRDSQLEAYSLRGRFNGLGFNAHQSYPGFTNLSGDLRLDGNGGRLQILPREVAVDVPKILGEPLRTERLSGAIVWRSGPKGWRVVSDNISLDHPQLQVATGFELTFGDDNAAFLDLHADLSGMTLPGLLDVMPRAILQPNVIEWLERALVEGDLPSATVDFSGPLSAFPFDNAEGEFRASAEVRNARIDYLRGWPVATEVNGTIVFNNASIRGAVNRANLSGNIVTGADLSIIDLRQAQFQFHSTADGLLDNLHSFLKDSPIAKSAGDIVNRLAFAGDGSVQVDLAIPLSKKIKKSPQVSVLISTQSGEVQLAGLSHKLERVGGSLRYRNGKFSAKAISAHVLGAPVVIDIMPDEIVTEGKHYPSTIAIARGQVSDRELARVHELLPTMLSGSTPYTATVTLPSQAANEPVRMEIVSRLVGMAVTLPEPLAKTAMQERDMVLNIALPEASAQTDVVIGSIANARLNWVRGDALVFDRGGLHFGTTPANLPEGAGLAITGAVTTLDVSDWIGRIADWSADSTGGGNKILQALNLHSEKLHVFGQTVADARITVDRSEREWLVQVDSATASGALFVPFSLADSPIIANMQVLHIALDDTVSDDKAQHDPREIPNMIVEVDDFRLGTLNLGKLNARLIQEADGVILEEFTIGNPSFSAQGRGDWEVTHDGQRSRIQLDLVSNDVALTLERLGFEGMIDASEANFALALNWPGPPGAGFREKLDGKVKVHVGPGQLDSVQPGAGRALGLLSFTALPRRLSLDFRDVFDKGFGFDFIQGDFTLDDGNAYTSNLVLEGPAAQVGISGRTGLVARDYDQTAVVYGNFGATLPVAGAIAGGPIGGAAMLIFSELFKRPLQNMARANYRITGSWDDPSVERVLAAENDESS